ncbi:interactor protein for cytohesin exchange factors 1 [Chanos chanos]|uniref:Interactor protein for cytohesin exchange factors 1 n=1 Tax=Chanos chanos TaxID=29144 RepID=A0A6J2V1D0_CHACN|nr:interactor protein for cytohesin exchange factors 1-like [Chanos chanos]
MSRRRVSVKDLGQVDCQGWLHKKKDGRGFLGNRWKKYWFVLKRSSLYWYSCQTAEKAIGYINLQDFTVEQAKESRRKYALRASHLQLVTLLFAAENVKEMNNVSQQGSPPPPRSSSSPCHPMIPLLSPVGNTSSESVLSESWLDVSIEQAQEAQPQNSDPTEDEEDQQPPLQGPCGEEKAASDEMEMLYLHLKKASLSPTGQLQPSTKRDFRSSFIRRCKDENINEKLHLVRALNSTLKAKEADLLAIEQVLSDPTLSACKYRKWREANVLLLQEICQQHSSESRSDPHQNLPEPSEPDSSSTASTSTIAITTSTTNIPRVYAETSV